MPNADFRVACGGGKRQTIKRKDKNLREMERGREK